MTNFPAPTQADEGATRLTIGGEVIDTRTRTGRRYKAVLRELAEQMGHELSASDRVQLTAAATLSLLIERDTLAMLQGTLTEEEPLRRNVQALRATLVSLGLSMKSRDVTKASLRKGRDSILSQLVVSD